MTMTHLSHFGLTHTGTLHDSVYLEGTLAACKRMAFAHGCTISGEEGRIIEMGSSGAICNMNDITGYWLAGPDGEHAGMIHRGRDGWTLVLNRQIWDAEA